MRTTPAVGLTNDHQALAERTKSPHRQPNHRTENLTAPRTWPHQLSDASGTYPLAFKRSLRAPVPLSLRVPVAWSMPASFLLSLRVPVAWSMPASFLLSLRVPVAWSMPASFLLSLRAPVAWSMPASFLLSLRVPVAWSMPASFLLSLRAKRGNLVGERYVVPAGGSLRRIAPRNTRLGIAWGDAPLDSRRSVPVRYTTPQSLCTAVSIRFKPNVP